MSVNQESHTLSKTILFWLVWAVGLIVIAATAQQWLPYEPSFPYADELVKTGLPKFIYSRANFDGVHYITIAEHGYKGTGLIQAFFPVYPLLMQGLGFLFGSSIASYLIAGVIISNLSLIGVLIIGYKLAAKLFDHQTGITFLLVLLTFPTSFYFGAVYNESLFLWLILLSVWYWDHQKNTFSGLLAGLSSGVRLVGAGLGVGYFLELLADAEFFKKTNQQNLLKKFKNFVSQNKVKLLSLLLSVSGLGIYMLYLWINFSDPVYFYSVQSEFGASRQTKIILLPQVFYRSIKILITARPINWKYYSYVQDFVLSILAGGGLMAAWLHKKIKLSYVIFGVIAYLLPTLTGNLSSMPRYILVLFPIQLWLAQYLTNKPKLKWLYFPISTLLLIINFSLFVQGHWVA